MGAPSIDISFIEKGISAVTRSERGIVMLWVKDKLPLSCTNPVTVIVESDIPEGLSKETTEQVKLAMTGYTNAPKKILVYCMETGMDTGEDTGTGGSEDLETGLNLEGIQTTTDSIEAGYKKAMEASETIKFDYLAIPTVETDGKTEDVATWVKSMRSNKKKKIKAVLPNVAADNEGIINFTTPEMVKTVTVTQKDGSRAVKDIIYN